MLKHALALTFLAVLGSEASAQSYLVQPNATGCLSRSQTQCVALGCDGTFTKYWWSCQALTDSTVALVIQPSGPFSATTTVGSHVNQGLSTSEQSSLQTETQLGTKLPWIITEVAFAARFTAPQLAAINASVDTVVVTNWTAIKGAATTNLQSATTTTLIARLVALGIITAVNAETVLAWTAVAQVQ